MFASRIARSGRTGARSSTKPMFRRYAFRVIMFAPTASPVVEHEGAEAARLGRRPRAAVEGVGEPALGVGERDEDVVLGAAALLDPAFRLGQLVLAERDPERPDDRHRRDGDTGQGLLRPRERRKVVRRHLAVEPERLLAGANRRRIVATGPLARLHAGSLVPHASYDLPMPAGRPVIADEPRAEPAALTSAPQAVPQAG